jgi:hypothetical protein
MRTEGGVVAGRVDGAERVKVERVESCAMAVPIDRKTRREL